MDARNIPVASALGLVLHARLTSDEYDSTRPARLVTVFTSGVVLRRPGPGSRERFAGEQNVTVLLDRGVEDFPGDPDMDARIQTASGNEAAEYLRCPQKTAPARFASQ